MQHTARIAVSASTVLFLMIAAATAVFAAESNVKISIENNGEGSSNNVDVKSDTTSGNTGSSNCNSRVVVNGKVIESDNCEPINYQSDDGSVKVNINSEGGGTPNPTAEAMQQEIRQNVEERLEKAGVRRRTKEQREERRAIREAREQKRVERQERRANKGRDVDKVLEGRFSLLSALFSWWPFKN